MATIGIKGTVTVRLWKPNPAALGRALAYMPATRATLLGIANAVAAEAQSNLMALGKPGNKVQYPMYRGRHWSAQPSAVAAQIKVKDSTLTFPLQAPGVRPAQVTRVAIVVADHPYSWPYEFGGMGIKASGFMRAAVRKIAASNSSIKLRRYRRPTAGGSP